MPPRGVIFVQSGDSLSKIARAHGTTIAALRRANRLRRSSRIRPGQRLRLPGAEVASRRVVDYGKPEHPGRVVLRGRQEDRTLVLRDDAGRVPEVSLEPLGAVMRRGEDDRIRRPDPRLALLLALISDHFGGRPVRVVSGFRVPGRGTSGGSRHVVGAAADVQIEGVSKRAVWDFCRSLRGTGCGLYPRSTFTHVDTRQGDAQWVDWSRPGRRARYGTMRRPYRRRERRSPRRSRVGRRITRPNALPATAEVAPEAPPAAEANAS